MKSQIIIYLDKNMKNYIVCRPTDLFEGNVSGLVEGVTGSNFSMGIKNYYKFEVV